MNARHARSAAATAFVVSILASCSSDNSGFGGDGNLNQSPGIQDATAPSEAAIAEEGGTVFSPDSGGPHSMPDAAAQDSGPAYPPLACNVEPPSGATVAPAFPKYAGTCPTLVAAASGGTTPAPNTIMSSGNARQFLLAVPSNLEPGEKLPVVFMWHWLAGSDVDFYEAGDVQTAVDQQRFLAVIPQKKGDIAWDWPFAISDSDARMAEEVQFFDDMLACVAEAFPAANENCVSSAGVSAGALFTDQLGYMRANRLSSILSMSGGLGGVIRSWSTPAHKLPALVLWGGPNDSCGPLNFATASQTLESDLVAENSFLVECIHNCGHSVPPVVAPPGQSTFAALWSFLFDHPFWLKPGQSPYLQGGLPSDYPSWCAIGAGKATMRTGPCNGSAC